MDESRNISLHVGDRRGGIVGLGLGFGFIATMSIPHRSIIADARMFDIEILSYAECSPLHYGVHIH